MVNSQADRERDQVLAVLQARCSSTRLPGKVLELINGRPMIEQQISRIRRAQLIHQLVVATSTDPSDDELVDVCSSLGVPVVRGPLDDVLTRFHMALQEHPANHVVRLTADCPLTSPRVIDEIITRHLESGSDYTSNCMHPTYPDGLDAEIMTASTLEWAVENAKPGPQREHVTLSIYSNPEIFTLTDVTNERDLSHLRWTVDLPEDLEFVRNVYAVLEPLKPNFESEDVLDLVESGRVTSRTDESAQRNSSLKRQLAEDPYA